jgi:hypothetical protein
MTTTLSARDRRPQLNVTIQSVREGLSRRSMLHGALRGAGLLAAAGSGLLPACAKDGARPVAPPLSLRYRGMNYDVGTDSGLAPSRATWHADSARRDIRTIRDDLHCNAVGVHGTDVTRLTETSAYALERGLHVWLQPRLFDVSGEEVLAHLASVAGEAERLRRQYTNVVLNVGVEMTLLNTGFVPGATIPERIAAFETLSASDWPPIMARLNDVLARALTLARDRFGGPLTYGAGPWEWADIDWRGFDIIGLDHYMDRTNRADYVDPLRQFRGAGKPVVVLEFGCCTYEGAEDAGGMGWAIVDDDNPGQLDGVYVRSEKTQADYIGHLLDLLHAERVSGAFVYQFVDPSLVHSSDARRDLDMASYGVVKVVSNDEQTGAFQWQPKRAFRVLAERYAAPLSAT